MPLRWRGSTALVEQPDSPRYLFGERITMTRHYKGPHALCVSSAPMRGALGGGSFTGWRVAQSAVQRERGTVGDLIVEWEPASSELGGGIALQLPPDEAEMEQRQIEEPLEHHPRYLGLISNELLNDVETLLNTDQTQTAYTDAKARVILNVLANELWQKKSQKKTHFQLDVPSYQMVLHYFSAPASVIGGFRENPPAIPISAPTAAGWEWVRNSDRVKYNGTTWQLIRTWTAGPQIDHTIYP